MKNIILSTLTLMQALEALNALSGEVMTLLVVDNEQRMVGTLTDGDVRRALLAGHTLTDSVADAMHRNFRWLAPDASPADIRAVRRDGIELLPVLDSERHIVDVLDLRRQTTRLPLRAVLMAGGRGERLRPLTDNTPKPLLPIGSSTVIDRNIDALRRCGVSDIYVTTRYLADQIEAHFSGSEVKCVRESSPLGTIGACALLPQPKADGITLLMNSDLVTNIDFEEFYLHHIRCGNVITVATVSHIVSIPFAILSTNGERVCGIEEKPTYTHYANAGIYLINNSLLASLSPEPTDAPDFIAAAIERGERVGHFPISGTWMDIGTPADYKQACELINLAKF